MSAKDPELLFAVLLSLWRERQRLLVLHAAGLLALPPSEQAPLSNTTLAELLSREPQYLPMPADQAAALDSQVADAGQALHARLARLDATIAMLRGAIGPPDTTDAQNPAHETGTSDADAYPSRPYLSVGARKRLRLLQDAQASSAPLPVAAYGRVVAPRLEAGETLHVPFSSGEAEACRRLVAESGSGRVGVETFAAAWTRLPGREPVDCMRYWASEGARRSGELSSRTEEGLGGSAARGGEERASGDGGGAARESNLSRMVEPAHHAIPDVPTPRPQDGMLSASLVPFRSMSNAPLHAPSLYPSLHHLICHAPLGSVGAAAASVRSGGAPTLLSRTQPSLFWRGLYRSFRASSVSTRPTGSVVDIAFSSQAPLRLVAGTNGAPHEALVYDLDSGSSRVLGQREPGTAHAAIVSAVRFTASSRRAVTAGYDNTVRVWDAADGRLMRVLGTRAAGAGGADAPGQGGQAAEGAAAGGEAMPGGAAGGAATPGGGGTLGAAGPTGLAAGLLGANPGGLVAPGDLAGGAATDPPPAWLYQGEISGHSHHVQCLCVHGSREPLAASGGKDNAVLFWDVERGEALRRLEFERSPLDLAFGSGAADASLFAALDSADQLRGMAVAYDVETGGRLFATPSPTAGHVSCLHCAVDGASILVGASGGSVRQLGARDGAVTFHFETGMPDVNVVSISCDGRYIQVGKGGKGTEGD
jgi:WD40 repeat protein